VPVMALEGSLTANQQFTWQWEAKTLASTLPAVPPIDAAMRVSQPSLEIRTWSNPPPTIVGIESMYALPVLELLEYPFRRELICLVKRC
jgi:hypothetical protein